MIDKNAFLQFADYETAVVQTPEWSQLPTVTVRNLNGLEQEQWHAVSKKLKADGVEVGVRLQCLACVFGIIDETGQNLFSVDDADALAREHPKVIDRIAERIYSLTAMTSHERAEIEKKANTSQMNGSGST